ncbi:MAG: hypothetical protein IPG74_12655 [Flavobacteriales bacterium]|nr:hypothetical protein [Flavobacteriales bacterium]
MRTDAAGLELWSESFGGSDWEIFSNIELAVDDGYILAGRSYSGTSGTQDGWLVRLDGGGQFLWQGFYGSLGEDFASSVVPLISGGFVFCGGKSVGQDMNAWLVRLDGTGQTVWDSLYGG